MNELLHSLRANSKPAARGRVKKMTKTYVWGKCLAAEPPVREKNGPSHSSPAPPNVFAKLTHVSLLAGYCLRAKTCSALKRLHGSFTFLSAYFSLKNRLGQLLRYPYNQLAALW